MTILPAGILRALLLCCSGRRLVTINPSILREEPTWPR